MSVPSDVMAQRRRRTGNRPEPRPQRKKQSFWASLCCGSADDDDYVEVVRHKRRTQEQTLPTSTPNMAEAPRPRPNSAVPSSVPAAAASTAPARKPLGDKPARALNKTSRPSETPTLLSYIPSTASPQTASALLAELSKPISGADEDGYIYIFWLTAESAGPAPSSTASTLLAPPTRAEQGRRTSDVLRQYSVHGAPRPRATSSGARPTSRSGPAAAAEPKQPDTILLKIGRANNVTRRMNEWTRQCGYSLSLVRYYPYVPSTPSPTPSPQASPAHSRRPSYNARGSDGVRKVPHAHRVERLVHIELAGKRVVKKCEACGKDHREWFEVEASREGVKGVDEVVKRWVKWAEEREED